MNKENPSKMNIHYSDVQNTKIKDAFEKVLEKYQTLHNYKIHLTQKRLGSSTMQAQPKLRIQNIYKGIDSYEITIGEVVFDTDIELADLPNDVLEGWFAHELGHVKDYTTYTPFGMGWYAIKYCISNDFTKKVEHEADRIALKKGFKNQIIATKKYLLTEGLISDRYKEKLSKYYLPLEAIEENPKDTLPSIYHQ